MTYPYPASIAVIAQLLLDRIEANKASFTIPVIDTFYGDQSQLAATPTICVEPNTKTRELAGVPNMTQNDFEIFIIVYISQVQDMNVSRKQADELAYDVEKFIHQDLQLKDPNNSNAPSLIHGFVRENESGYSIKKSTMYRSARLTYFGRNKTSLPAN